MTSDEFFSFSKAIVRRYKMPKYIKSIYFDDILSEVMVAVVKAFYRYDTVRSSGRGDDEQKRINYMRLYGHFIIQDFMKTKREELSKLQKVKPQYKDLNDWAIQTATRSPLDELIYKEEELFKREKAVNLHSMIDNCGLTPKQRVCLEKFYLGGLTQTQIGKEFDPPITKQAVCDYVKNAIKKLKVFSGGMK
jgi:RNA polymerase sigma factor (sigma-70 family)